MTNVNAENCKDVQWIISSQVPERLISMGKVQRIDNELHQAIIYPRVRNRCKNLKIYAGLSRDRKK